MTDSDIFDRIMVHEIANRDACFKAWMSEIGGYWEDFHRFMAIANEQKKLANALWSQVDGE